jgi:hypothetical protein
MRHLHNINAVLSRLIQHDVAAHGPNAHVRAKFRTRLINKRLLTEEAKRIEKKLAQPFCALRGSDVPLLCNWKFASDRPAQPAIFDTASCIVAGCRACFPIHLGIDLVQKCAQRVVTLQDDSSPVAK